MSDLIDRQAAIDALYHVDEYNWLSVKAIRNLPSAEGRKKGKWIGLDDDAVMTDTVQCSVCRKQFTVDADRFYDIGFVIEDLRFCPNCGARMEVEDDIS